MRNLIIVIFVLLSSIILSKTVSNTNEQFSIYPQNLSNAVDTAWVKHYASQLLPSKYNVADITNDKLGNVFITGTLFGEPFGADYVTIKYNSVGEEAWKVRYNGPGNSDDYAHSIAVDAFGNLYVTGRSCPSEYFSDYLTIKYNPEGIEQWIARYNEVANTENFPADLTVDHLGNVYVIGKSYGDYATIKYNPDGVEQWIARYDGGTEWDEATSLVVDISGNVYVTGRSYGENTNYDYATIKYNSNGIEQWIARYNGPAGNSSDEGRALALDASGNVYVTGGSQGNAYDYDYATVKYNSEGEEQWVGRYNGPESSTDVANDLAVDILGNIYVTGTSAVGMGKGSDYVTVKYNTNGFEQWVVNYNTPWPRPGYPSNDRSIALKLDNGGNVYVTGTDEKGGDGYDYATVKYNSDGQEQWIVHSKLLTTPEKQVGFSVDDFDNVYLTGTNYDKEVNATNATIKYNSAGEKQWIAGYVGPGTSVDNASGLAVDRFGNVYVTGYSSAKSSGSDFATIKYNSSGEMAWIARYNDESDFSLDVAGALAVDYDGNVYVTGTKYSTVELHDYVTLKYNSSGVEQWVEKYDAPEYRSNDYTSGIAVDNTGNVYVTGSTTTKSDSSDFLTVKYSSDGVEQWIARYNGPRNTNDIAVAIAVDDLGNAYVTGKCNGVYLPGLGNWFYDYATIKYNPDGIEQWVALYNGTLGLSDWPTAIALDDSGNVYVTGTGSSETSNYDYTTIKYNSNGIEQWIASYDGPGSGTGSDFDKATAIAIDPSGNVYVTGLSKSSEWGDDGDYATVKYNSEGVEQWIARYDGPVSTRYVCTDYGKAIALDTLGNVYVTGESKGIGTMIDYATIKYNSAGNQQWIARYNYQSNYNDKVKGLALDPTGNVYVSGSTSHPEGNLKWSIYTTIKYVQTPTAIFTSSKQGLDFGTAAIGSSVIESLKIINQGILTLEISSANSDHEEFYVEPSSATIPSGSSALFQITCQPLTLGEKRGHIIFQHNGSSSPDSIYVRGETVDAELSILPQILEFGQVSMDTTALDSFKVFNRGHVKLSIDSLFSTDLNFSVLPTRSNISPGDSALFVVSFNPDSVGHYSAYIILIHNSSSSPDSVEVRADGVLSEVEGHSYTPSSYALHQNYPNPFNPETTIRFSLPIAQNVKLTIYDISGREVITLIDDKLSAGEHSVQWNVYRDTKIVASGVYIYRLQTNNYSAVNKMLLVH